jgi:hypothetical protein
LTAPRSDDELNLTIPLALLVLALLAGFGALHWRQWRRRREMSAYY